MRFPLNATYATHTTPMKTLWIPKGVDNFFCFRKCENKSECPEYYKYVLALVSGGAVILGIVILSTLMFSKAQTIKSDKDSSI